MHPDLPIDRLTRGEWIDAYDHELLAAYSATYGRCATAAEWAEYVCLMWEAQVKHEDELASTVKGN